MKSNSANPNGEIVVAINLKLFHSFSLKIVKIEFKMKPQSPFSVWSFSKCMQNLTFYIFHLTYQNGMNQSFPCS